MINTEEFEQLKSSVSRIEIAICGDEQMGAEGLVKRISKLEKWQGQVKLRMAFIAGGFVTIWEAARAGMEYLKHK